MSTELIRRMSNRISEMSNSMTCKLLLNENQKLGKRHELNYKLSICAGVPPSWQMETDKLANKCKNLR